MSVLDAPDIYNHQCYQYSFTIVSFDDDHDDGGDDDYSGACGSGMAGDGDDALLIVVLVEVGAVGVAFFSSWIHAD